MNIEKIIELLSKRPLMYFDYKSCFLLDYFFSGIDFNDELKPSYATFRRWVIIKYGYHHQTSFIKILIIEAGSDELAYDLLLREYSIFLQQVEKIGSDVISKECEAPFSGKKIKRKIKVKFDV